MEMSRLRRMVCAAAVALSAVSGIQAGTPTLTDVTAKQRYPWNGLVDITCNVTGIKGATNGVEFAVAALKPDSSSACNVSHVRVVRDGVLSADRAVHTNGSYRLVWDAKADLGQVRYGNMVVDVTLAERGKVQLWEGGPYWATENIGAEKPEEYGCYFWWGDTVGYRRENDAWVANDGSSSNFSFGSGNTPTYNKNVATLQSEGWITADNVLAPEHDAAQVQWGGSWRMPTDQEFSALVSNCDWTWTTVNGVNGYVVRGKGAYASNSIFLPCAGYGYGTSLGNAGSYGYYWSSVPYSGSSYYSWDLDFNSGYHYMGSYYRSRGQSVRPVQTSVTITFDANGGTVSPSSQSYAANGTYGSLPTPSYPSHTFLGWFTAADGGTQVMVASTVPSSAVTLYAHWKDGVQLWAGGPCWAETNIGAEKPEEYGYYFWWGDTVGYKWMNNHWEASDGSSSSFSFDADHVPTYGKDSAALQSEGWITADNVLAPGHDAAQVQWGGGWRMPTKEELSALFSQCDWTWTTQNGVNGYVVRGKGTYAANSIFLPCAGYGYGTSLGNAGSYGYYWSSVPDSGYYRSWFLYFNSGFHDMSSSRRYYGQSVRPVQGAAD